MGFWYRNDVAAKRVQGWTEAFLNWPLREIWLAAILADSGRIQT
jgi:hypothetical protein